MKNILIEGIQGSGKSTFVQRISKEYPSLCVCREGDYSLIDLAWCTWMSGKEYEAVLEKYDAIRDDIISNTVREEDHYIISYTKIITDIPGFHKDLEKYEIYNGRKSLQELKEIVFTRFQNYKEKGHLFECALFQNIMEELMLFQMLSDEEIIAFYRELLQVIDLENFVFIYLNSEYLEENIRIIQKERCDDAGHAIWYELMLGYLKHSPYGKKHGCDNFRDLLAHLKHRQELELFIIKEFLGDNAIVLPAKKYDLKEVISMMQCVEKNNYVIRYLQESEYGLLDDFLYEAIFIPEGIAAPPKDIINAPELQVYVKDFGKQEGDMCLVAEVDDKIVGAVWVRIMDDYGHIEDGVPSFAISLYKEYRGRGIGTSLMKQMLAELKKKGYQKTSLAVQKENYAVRMYKKVGFKIMNENAEEYIMVCVL